MPFIVGTLQARLELNPGQFNRALDRAKGRGDTFARNFARNTKRLSRELGAVGSAMTRNVTVPLLGLGALSARAAIKFESSFAGVRKTVDATEEELQGLREGLRTMAREEIPLDVDSLARIAELGGQLNIQTGNLLGFTRTIAMIGDTTDIAIESAAEGFAQFGNIMQTPQRELDRMGAAIVDLGNSSATTESKILDFGLRIAGAGRVAGLTEAQVLGFGAALASVGLEAEAGGTAISRTIFEIAGAVERGGDRLEQFADVAGESADEFRNRFRRDAAGAIVAFVEGLGRMQSEGRNVAIVLDELGIDQIRVRDALLRTAGAGELMRESITRGTKAWRENAALVAEAGKRYETTESVLRKTLNQLNDVGITVGEELLPALVPAAQLAGDFAQAFGRLPRPLQQFALGAGAAAAAVGPLFLAGKGLVSTWRTMRPLMTRVGPALRTVAGAAGTLASAVATLNGVLVIAAGAIGGLVGLSIRGWVNDVTGLGDAMGLVAHKNSDLVDGLLASEHAFENAVAQLEHLKTQLGLTGEQWEYSTERTRANAERILMLLDLIPRLNHEELKEAAAARAAATARDQAADSTAGAIVQTEEQQQAIADVITELENELAQLQLSNRAYLERRLRAMNATEAEISARLAIQDKIDAERRRIDVEEEAELVAEHRQQTIAAIIESLEDEQRGLTANRKALTLDRLARLGAGAAILAQADAIEESIAAHQRQVMLQAEAEQIISRSLTVEQQRAIEQARINELYRLGFLSLQQYNQALDELSARFDKANVHGLRMAVTAEDIALAAHQAFAANLFEPFDESLRGMVDAFVKALQQMVAEALATQLFQALNLGSLLGLSGGGAVTASATPVGKAAGGVVMGPGTATSDSIPALLSDGEFIVRAAAVRRYGTGLFDALNDMRVPTLDRLQAFAGGGAVGGAGAVALGSGGGSFNVNIDARGAAPGVGAEIRRALAETEKRAVTRSVATMVDRRRRGGAFAENFRR